ncbi:hypothetical protein K438DRAFT_1544831, partial [Mycena galopus ATCC 62051]
RAQIGGERISYQWLQGLPQAECLYRFRLKADEIADLADVLDIPSPFRTTSRYAFSRFEALALLLARFRSAGDIQDLSMMYDRCHSSISELVNELSEYLDERWGHLLDFDSNGLLSPASMQEYADAIHDSGAPLDGIWGFIDCTIRAVCRPRFFQRVAYNGYKKIHATKFQAVKL